MRHIARTLRWWQIYQYRKPEKRGGGKNQSDEQVAHKVAWAVKRTYVKQGDRWIEKAT
ncbi:MAG: hypothetical protein WBZ36_11900 [Candidatus Nitrosopolaris sp.]